MTSRRPAGRFAACTFSDERDIAASSRSRNGVAPSRVRVSRADSVATRISGSAGSRSVAISIAVSASSSGTPRSRKRRIASRYRERASPGRPSRAARPAWIERRQAAKVGPRAPVASNAARASSAVAASRSRRARSVRPHRRRRGGVPRANWPGSRAMPVEVRQRTRASGDRCQRS